MALNDENNGGIGATMLVGPTGVGGNNGGMFGSDWGGLLILFLFAAMFGGFGGGWGMGGFGGGFGNMYEFPWLLNGQQQISNNTSNGFRDSMLQDNITSVRDGVGNLATQLCGCCGDIQMGIAGVNQNISSAASGIQNSLCQGFSGTTAAINGAQNALAQQLYTNQIADLERSYAAQTASTQGMNAIQTQLAQNGMGTQMGFADTKYTLASEACATRTNSTQNTQGILNAINSGIQSIKDQLCQDKIDAKNDEIASLRQQIAMKDLAASQTAQNAFIAQGFSNEVDQLYNRLNSCPVPTTPVYGRTPIFTCNNGCGCSGNNFGV